jgi:hypothetical protein
MRLKRKNMLRIPLLARNMPAIRATRRNPSVP